MYYFNHRWILIRKVKYENNSFEDENKDTIN